MNQKVKEFLDAQEKKNEKEKEKTLIELGLYEIELAPMICHGHVKGDNKIFKFTIKNEFVKIGDIVKISKNRETLDVIIDKIKYEQSSEFPEIAWDSDNSTNKYYRKVPVEITDEEYQKVKNIQKPMF